MARCACGILPLITVDPDSALTLTGTGTTGDPIVLGNDPSFMDMLEFTTAGAANFTKAAFPGLRFVRVRAIGGGGGSASVNAGAGVGVARGGGGGGGYAESWIAATALPAITPITVGAGGAGGAGGGNNPGSVGGQSDFGAFVTAVGGSGSIAIAVAVAGFVVSDGGIGGAGNIGDINIAGGNGQDGVQWSSTQRIGGEGGAGGGYGSSGKANYNLGTGLAGTRHGGGASGPAAFNGSFAGSAGASGAVFVELFR